MGCNFTGKLPLGEEHEAIGYACTCTVDGCIHDDFDEPPLAFGELVSSSNRFADGAGSGCGAGPGAARAATRRRAAIRRRRRGVAERRRRGALRAAAPRDGGGRSYSEWQRTFDLRGRGSQHRRGQRLGGENQAPGQGDDDPRLRGEFGRLRERLRPRKSRLRRARLQRRVRQPLLLGGEGLAVSLSLDAAPPRQLFGFPFPLVTIVPGLLRFMGHAAWWMPGWLDRILPTIHIDDAGEATELSNEPQPSSSG